MAEYVAGLIDPGSGVARGGGAAALWPRDRVTGMSDESYSGEEMNTDIGSFSVDDEDQLQSGDTLEDPDVDSPDDVLDAGYSPPDRARGSLAFGTTAWEQSQEETIEQRITQEIPDPDSAYGAPDNESGLDEPEMLGGDDPDAIPVDDDFVSDSGARAGRLVAPDQGTGEDVDQDSGSPRGAGEFAADVGIDGAGASAEEAAMHIASDEPGDEALGTDDVATRGAADAGPLSEAAADAIRDEDETNELDSLRSANDDS